MVILGEGNPDEEKIGAFGVGQFLICGSDLKLILLEGFYSLFSITEKPSVTSGGESPSFLYHIIVFERLQDKWVIFHWKDGKNQVSEPA